MQGTEARPRCRELRHDRPAGKVVVFDEKVVVFVENDEKVVFFNEKVDVFVEPTKNRDRYVMQQKMLNAPPPQYSIEAPQRF